MDATMLIVLLGVGAILFVALKPPPPPPPDPFGSLAKLAGNLVPLFV